MLGGMGDPARWHQPAQGWADSPGTMQSFSDEQKAEMAAVEAEIKRRIAIGATVSERRIREDIARIGMSEAMVARTVTYLVTRGSLEFRHGRRSIYRKE